MARGGPLQAQRPDAVATGAEELYCKALDIAKEQKAKLWELRAAVSLARLHCDEGRRAEARDLLAPVYGWFTEGFDTQDLKEAKALLDELDRSSAPTRWRGTMVVELGSRAVRSLVPPTVTWGLACSSVLI